jgi:hypothetical protein
MPLAGFGFRFSISLTSFCMNHYDEGYDTSDESWYQQARM